MNHNRYDFSTPEGNRLIRKLYAFSNGIFKSLYRTEINERGKSFTDYVHDAIEKHLKGEDNFDPIKSPIEFHLKYHLIRQLLYNDLPASVKRQRKELLSNPRLEESNLSPKQVAVMQLATEPIITGLLEYDRKIIYDEIEKVINGDDILEQFYLAVCHDDFEFNQRAEICKEYKLTESEFDNGKRRFMTALKKVFKELKLT